MSTPTSAPPRTLADDLRARDDVALAALLAARPDLVSPVPTDMTNLVARATTRTSVNRVLEQLDMFTLQVLDALVFLPDPTDLAAVTSLVPAPAAALRKAVDLLRELALIWGPDTSLRLVRTVREVIGPNPGGLGPPLAVAAGLYSPARLQGLLDDLGLTSTADPTGALTALRDLLGDPDRVADVLADAPAAARELLGVLDTGAGSGRVARADRDVRTASASTPLEWLLARGLIVAVDRETVSLPAEVGVALRGGALHREPALAPPPAQEIPGPGAATADKAAAGQALTVVRQVEDLLDGWALEPPGVLRTGGLGVRDLKRASTALDLDPHLTALVIETAYVAGLLAADSEDAEYWLPTPEFDRWRALEPGARWVALVHAWLDSSRVVGLVGARSDAAGAGRDKPLAALGRDLDRGLAPEIRRATLAELASLPAGTAATPESLLARLVWRRPRRGGRLRGDLVPWTLTEAAHLGVTGRGALACYARPLLLEDAKAAAARLEPLLPEPLDHVLLQADLTAVAPGPLVRGLAADLALAADIESTGGATVYRFSDASIRRALDAGRSAGELHELFKRASRTPVPQPLTYLVDDVARRHGRMRVGAASAYLRCDDESVLAELAADKRTAPLGLRRLAPTVAIAEVGVDALLARLRELGYAPAAESAAGDVVIRRPDARRTGPHPLPRPVLAERPPPTAQLRAAAVRALRAGDRAATAGARRLAGSALDDAAAAAGAGHVGADRPSTTTTLQRLREAAEGGASVWLGYVDNDGTVTERIVDPISVEGGFLTAFDHRQHRPRNFAIARITAVADA